MSNLNYELAPKPGMLASQRKAELDAARFVAVRNLAYMIYQKPDGTPLMTYQETLDNRELVKNAVIAHEISMGHLQNDLGTSLAAPPQQPQMIPQNGAQMSAQPPMQQPMPFQPQPAAAPMSPAQFAQAPMMPSAPQMVPQPQFAPQPPQAQPQQQFAPQQQQFAPQAQFPQQPQFPQQQQFPQMQPTPMAAPAAPPMEAAPVTGKKRRAASGNSVAPPPQASMAVPPGMAQAPVPAQPAAVPVMQFSPQPPAPAQPQFVPQAPMPQPGPMAAPGQQVDVNAIIGKIDSLGKGLEIAASNSHNAVESVAKMKADLTELKQIVTQTLVCLHHMYLTHPSLSGATEGKAGTLQDFQKFLQKYIGNPQ